MRQKLAKFIGKALRELNLSWQKETLAKRESLQTRLAFLAVAGVILTAEIYIAVCVKGGFVRHYAGDVLAVILLYALARAIFSVAPSKLPLKIFCFCGGFGDCVVFWSGANFKHRK